MKGNTHRTNYIKLMNRMITDLHHENPAMSLYGAATGFENLPQYVQLFYKDQMDFKSMLARTQPDFCLWLNGQCVGYDLKETESYNAKTGNICMVWYEFVFQRNYPESYLIFEKQNQWYVLDLKTITKPVIKVPAVASNNTVLLWQMLNNYATHLKYDPASIISEYCPRNNGSNKPFILIPTHNAIPLDVHLNGLAAKYRKVA